MHILPAIALKEVKEIYRVRLFLALAFFVPFTMFIVFGYGISLDVEHMPFAYVDMDKTQMSADLIEKFKGRYFDLKHELFEPREADRLLQGGTLRAALVIPPGFMRNIKHGRDSEVQLLVDGGYPYRALTVRGYSEVIVSEYNLRLVAARGKAFVPVNLQTRYLFNESLKSSNALIPGLITIVLLMNPAVLTALAITREKEFGTIYNIYSSPVRRWQFLAGKIIPYLFISAINFAVLMATIRFLFHIQMKGSVLTLIPPAFVYVLITVSIGIIVSSITRTMVSAQIVTLIVTVIPAFLYSGLFLPVSSLEGGARVFAYLLPSMHFMKVVHGVYLKNLNFVKLLPHTLLLVLYFCILFSIGVLTFRKREK